MDLWHVFSLVQTPLDDPVRIFIPFQMNLTFHFPNPFVVWERLRQFGCRPNLCPG